MVGYWPTCRSAPADDRSTRSEHGRSLDRHRLGSAHARVHAPVGCRGCPGPVQSSRDRTPQLLPRLVSHRLDRRSCDGLSGPPTCRRVWLDDGRRRPTVSVGAVLRAGASTADRAGSRLVPGSGRVGTAVLGRTRLDDSPRPVTKGVPSSQPVWPLRTTSSRRATRGSPHPTWRPAVVETCQPLDDPWVVVELTTCGWVPGDSQGGFGRGGGWVPGRPPSATLSRSVVGSGPAARGVLRHLAGPVRSGRAPALPVRWRELAAFRAAKPANLRQLSGRAAIGFDM
jgi:hypothetical protein